MRLRRYDKGQKRGYLSIKSGNNVAEKTLKLSVFRASAANRGDFHGKPYPTTSKK